MERIPGFYVVIIKDGINAVAERSLNLWSTKEEYEWTICSDENGSMSEDDFEFIAPTPLDLDALIKHYKQCKVIEVAEKQVKYILKLKCTCCGSITTETKEYESTDDFMRWLNSMLEYKAILMPCGDFTTVHQLVGYKKEQP